MTTTTTTTDGACPVAAILPGLEHVIGLQNDLRAEGVTGDKLAALGDRQRAFEAVAETGHATSLPGAALQVILGAHAAADMGAALSGGGMGWGGRDSDHLDRVAEATARSAYAVLAAHGGALAAAVVVADYWPAD